MALRTEISTDGMTYDVLEKVSNRIVNKVDNVNRIVCDVTSMLLATIGRA